MLDEEIEDIENYSDSFIDLKEKLKRRLDGCSELNEMKACTSNQNNALVVPKSNFGSRLGRRTFGCLPI